MIAEMEQIADMPMLPSMKTIPGATTVRSIEAHRSKMSPDEARRLYPNLELFGDIPRERHHELSVRGGYASGKARRAKREAIERRKVELIAQREVMREEIERIEAITAALLQLASN